MKKVLSALLAAALVVTLAVPAHSPLSSVAYAASGVSVSNVIYDSASVNAINSFYDNVNTNWITKGFDKTSFWTANNAAMKGMIMGEVSYVQLASYVEQYEKFFTNKFASLLGVLDVSITYDPTHNCYRMYDSAIRAYLVYGTGAFPYVAATKDSNGDTVIETGTDHWVLKKNVDFSKSHVLARDSLHLLAYQIEGDKNVSLAIYKDPYWGIMWYNDSVSSGGRYFWCDADGHPYG